MEVRFQSKIVIFAGSRVKVNVRFRNVSVSAAEGNIVMPEGELLGILPIHTLYPGKGFFYVQATSYAPHRVMASIFDQMEDAFYG